MTDAISQSPNNGNQETIHESNYWTETFPKTYDINELPKDMFPINVNIIELKQHNYPWITAELTCITYKHGHCCGGRNIYFDLIICKAIVLLCQNYKYT